MRDKRTFAIVGGGQAGGWIARTLRSEGFEGRVLLIGEEPYHPYERPPLSKSALAGDSRLEKLYFWPPHSFSELEIEVMPRTRVTALDPTAKRLSLQTGDSLAYDRLAIATGARPRLLPVDGVGLEGIRYLRGIDDSLAIRNDIGPESRVLIVGGGWIGLEVASTLTGLGCEAVVVESAERLCARAVSPFVSDWMLDIHRRHGVDIRLSTAVEAFEGSLRVERARLTNGDIVECSSAVIGIGVIPNLDLAAEAGLATGNGIIVDEFCRTSDADVFAAGDVSFHPNRRLARNIRLESWENAQNQGIAAAKSMLGKEEAYDEIPWFWSDQHGVNIQMIGLPEIWDEVVVRGSPGEDAFMIAYLKRDLIVGAVAVDNPRDIRVAKRLMLSGRQVSAEDLGDPGIKLQSLLRQ